MEIKFKKKELCDLIEKYYREIKNTDAKVSISTKREPTGRFEIMSTVTRVEVTKKVNVLGIEKSTKEQISEEVIVGILNELLKTSEYLVLSLSYDAGVTPVSVGYYMDEHTEYRPYFNGVTLYVREREKSNSRKLK